MVTGAQRVLLVGLGILGGRIGQQNARPRVVDGSAQGIGIEDAREVYEIPAIRAFYRSFRQAWPLWFFACDVEMPSLQAMTFCCLPSLRVVRREIAPFQRVHLDQGELVRLCSRQLHGHELAVPTGRDDRAGEPGSQSKRIGVLSPRLVSLCLLLTAEICETGDGIWQVARTELLAWLAYRPSHWTRNNAQVVP